MEDEKDQIYLPVDRTKYWLREMKQFFEEIKMQSDFYLQKLEEIETIYGINHQKQKIYMERDKDERKNGKDKELPRSNQGNGKIDSKA